jgi:hypothetical protein
VITPGYRLALERPKNGMAQQIAASGRARIATTPSPTHDMIAWARGLGFARAAR